MKKLMENKLVQQILKFGVVGGISFLIDWITGLVVLNVLCAINGDAFYDTASMIATPIGFSVSVIANYIMSFKFVFERKEDMDRKNEFVIFLVLSLIGLGINQLVVKGSNYVITNQLANLSAVLNISLMYTIAKVIATAVVMVFNFVTRKIFLEKKN